MKLAVTACFLLYSFVNGKDSLESPVEEILSVKNFRNISDDKLMIEQHTFINDNGFRRSGGEKESLRIPPKYLPSEKALNLKVLDIMRQAIYDTQYDMKRLDPVLDKHKDNPALRMAFIFDRLRQLIIDIRRVYTLALKWRDKRRVYEQIIWYTYCTRKHIDVQYILEHLIEKHNEYVKLFDKG